MTSLFPTYLDKTNLNYVAQFSWEGGIRYLCATHYQFNCLERFGNALLSPLAGAIETYDKRASVCRKLAMVIKGIFLSVIALIGAIAKRIGELINSQGSLRQSALALFIKIQAQASHNLIATPSSPEMSGIIDKGVPSLKQMERIFFDFLKTRFRVTDGPCELLRISVLKKRPLNRDESAHIRPLLAFFNQYRLALGNLQMKITSNQDFSTEQQDLEKIVPSNDQFRQAINQCIREFQEIEPVKAQRAFYQSIEEYNQILSRMQAYK